MRFLKIERDLIELKNQVLAFKEESKKQEERRASIMMDEYSTDELILISSQFLKGNKKTNERFVGIILQTLFDARLMDYFHSERKSLERFLLTFSDDIEDDIEYHIEYEEKEEEKNIQYTYMNEALNSILNKVDLLFHVESLSKTNQDKYNYIYAVKLPQYECFDDVADFTKQLNLIFSIVMNDNKKVKLVGFDKGSEWYQVALDNLIDFKIMTLFISEVTRWVKYVVEDKRRINEIDMDARKMILENMESNQMMLRDYAVKKVLGESGNADDHEENSKHQIAFERMAELIIKGTKVEIDKQDSSNEPSTNESEVALGIPRIEDIQGLLEMGRDLLIGHNPSSEDE